MNETILTVKDLKTQFYTYAGVVKALDGVSFSITKGETFGLVGETGCGKSVTALSILRLVATPGKIIDGEVYFKGEDLLKKMEKEMRSIRGREISMIFQDPTRSLNPVFTIGYQMAEPYIYHQNFNKPEALISAEDLLVSMDISNPDKRMKNYPHEFSGGMRQRIMIGMALACRPSLLIADEPTTNLDVTIQAQILDLLKNLQKKYETSILWITHNLGVIAEVCDRVAVMYAGNIVEIGDVKTILVEPSHPYTRMLKGCVPRTSKEKGKLAIIPGTVPNLINPPTGCRFHPRCAEAKDLCKTKKPEAREIEPGHFVSCWRYPYNNARARKGE